MSNITFTGSLRFTNNDMARIIKYSAYRLGKGDQFVTQATLMQLIQKQLLDVEGASNWLVAVVQDDLDTLDTLDTDLTSVKGSTEAFQTKVDVLEWADRPQFEGIEQRFWDLRDRIAKILAREFDVSGGMGRGLSPLGRG